MKNHSDKTPINQWSEDDRPREKLMLKGKAALSDAELIAILLGSGSSDETAVDLARRILNDVQNNLIELSALTVGDLSKYKGIGEAKAISIVAAMELGRRRRGAEVIRKKKVVCSNDAFEVFQTYIGDAHYERFMIILLNNANRLIKVVNISEGGLAATVTDIRKIFKIALDHNASAMVLGHNHPSGNLQPSNSDIALTQKIVNAGKVLDIGVLDHIIVGKEKYYSFKDESQM
jgi:DNA repair protein RadC